MPIIIKDFIWKQTEEKLLIQVPLKGIHPSKVDIFTSPQYIKASFEQYFFDMVLLDTTDISSSKCTKTSSEIIFELVKNVPKLWETLEVDLPKKEKLELKKKLIQEEHERFQKQCDEKVGKKAELKRVAVREQIALDTRIREDIDKSRKFEEQNALGDLNQWKKALKKEVRPKIIEIEDLPDEDLEQNLPNLEPRVLKPKKLINKPKKVKQKTEVPKLRSTRSLQVLFTPREFETPKRESKLEEENEWLRQQAQARRSAGFISDDIRPEERNPQFLKAKGDEFMKNKNYLGALSAYSFGIKLSNKFVDLYLARSEAHLAVGNFGKVVEDTSSALNLLKPALPINLNQRALCIGRRGIGLYKLGMLKQGISELQSSLKLKFDEGFQNNLKEAEEILKTQKENGNNEDKKENISTEELFH